MKVGPIATITGAMAKFLHNFFLHFFGWVVGGGQLNIPR